MRERVWGLEWFHLLESAGSKTIPRFPGGDPGGDPRSVRDGKYKDDIWCVRLCKG